MFQEKNDKIKHMPNTKPATIDEYINAAPKEAQSKTTRNTRNPVKKVAPKALRALKWGSPVFEEKRILFASAALNRILILCQPSAMRPFKKELVKYTTGKGSIQFPYDKPLPKMLIRKIAALRVMELRERDVRWM
jgi:uncharacterized protein YdhG (YjbR/CyaY superfamily)